MLRERERPLGQKMLKPERGNRYPSQRCWKATWLVTNRQKKEMFWQPHSNMIFDNHSHFAIWFGVGARVDVWLNSSIRDIRSPFPLWRARHIREIHHHLNPSSTSSSSSLRPSSASHRFLTISSAHPGLMLSRRVVENERTPCPAPASAACASFHL